MDIQLLDIHRGHTGTCTLYVNVFRIVTLPQTEYRECLPSSHFYRVTKLFDLQV